MENIIQINKNEIVFFNQLDEFIGIYDNWKVYSIDEIKLKGKYGTTGGKYTRRCVQLDGIELNNVKSIEEVKPENTYSQFTKKVNDYVSHLKNLGYSQSEINIQYFIGFDTCDGLRYGQLRCSIKTNFSKNDLNFDLYFVNSYSPEYGDTTYSFRSIYIFTNESYTKQKMIED